MNIPLRKLRRIKRHVMTYEECAHVGIRHHNDNGFCSVVAMSVACDIAFSRARSIMAKMINRRNGKGTYPAQVHKLLDLMGYKCEYVSISSKTLKTAQRELANTKGAYYLYTRGHVSCVKDGVMQDWARNDLRPSNKRIESVYKITPTNEVIRY